MNLSLVGLVVRLPVLTLMSSVVRKSAVVFKQLTPAYVGSAVDCVAASFLDDPFTKVAKLEPSDWAYISSMFIQRAATKDLSIVAGRRNYFQNEFKNAEI